MTNNPIEKYYIGGCRVCANLCNIDRNKISGLCKADNNLKIASVSLHYGEEPPISGTRGSGTVFFTNCSMGCVYCQNYPVSQYGVGNIRSIDWLAESMLSLQDRGAHNINFVTPTHYSCHIYDAVAKAKVSGLKIPVVYNTSSYENHEIIDFINEFADIYLADIRYSNDNDALYFSKIKNYKKIVFNNVKKFYESKGRLVLDEEGIALKGVLIRVLLLPGMVSAMKDIINFISNEIDKNAYVSLMSQYVPYYLNESYATINRRVFKSEYQQILEYADKVGMINAFIQNISEMEEQ